MPGGRPTKYTEELLTETRKYIKDWGKDGDVIPSKCALGLRLGVSEETIQAWMKDDSKPEFSVYTSKITQMQKNILKNGGICGRFNAPITKLLLSGHGVVEKTIQEQDIKVEVSTLPPELTEIADKYVSKDES